MKSFSLIHILRGMLFLLLFYAGAESLARYRFACINPSFPRDLRKNMGLNAYDAHKLFSNVELISRDGISYKTDSLGFRIPAKSEKARPAVYGNCLLLGGDSRIFGMGYDYHETPAGLFSQSFVHLQALPGGCPLFFKEDLFLNEAFKKLDPAPQVLVYAYDREDVRNDRDFASEKKIVHGALSPRRIKLALGGYLYSWLGIKFESFKNKWSLGKGNKESKPNLEEKKTETDFSKTLFVPPLGSPTLAELRDHLGSLQELFLESKKRGLDIYLLYLPRLDELQKNETGYGDSLKIFAQQNSIAFIDVFDLLQKSDPAPASLFADAQEGIHFNQKGLKLITLAIKQATGLK